MVLHKVALNVYNRPWLIEPQSAMNLMAMWERIMKNETTFRAEMEEQDNTIHKIKQLFAKSDIAFAPDNYYDAKNFSGFEGSSVAVIPVMGPLMKNDFCGWFGTGTLQNMVRLAENTPSVKVIVPWVDSPGGTVDGTESFANTIKASKKHTMTIADGMMCSAAYWIGSSSNEVIAANKTDVIGSIGTMMSWWDSTKVIEERGYQKREFFATDSVDKNKMFRDANSGDGRALVQEMLDPMNDVFTGTVKANRKGKIDQAKENVLTGKTYVSSAAKEAGLIDLITPFDKALNKALSMAKTLK